MRDDDGGKVHSSAIYSERRQYGKWIRLSTMASIMTLLHLARSPETGLKDELY